MALLDELKADQLAARKSNDRLKADLLTTLIGEASQVTTEEFKRGVTEVTDEKVAATVAKFLKNTKLTLENLASERARLIDAGADASKVALRAHQTRRRDAQHHQGDGVEPQQVPPTDVRLLPPPPDTGDDRADDQPGDALPQTTAQQRDLVGHRDGIEPDHEIGLLPGNAAHCSSRMSSRSRSGPRSSKGRMVEWILYLSAR